MIAILFLALAPAQDPWTSLPLPGISRESASASAPEPLARGEHLVLDQPARLRPRPAEGSRPAPAALPASLLAGLVQEEARRSGSGLQVLASGPSLLARGPADAVEDLRGRLSELDRAGERLSIEIEAWLVPGGSPAGSPPAAGSALPPAAERAQAAGLAWRAGVRSGEALFLGRRESVPFLAGYRVEVASDSGVAAPIVGRAHFGRTLHLVACRASRGQRVHVEGLLDLAELSGMERFDPGTPDLGIVEQPLVHAVQAAFAGTLAAGEFLRLDLEGLPLEVPRWTIWLRARSEPDGPLGEGPGWELIDLAFLARPPREPLGLDPDALFAGGSEARLPRIVEALAPPSLAAGLPGDPRRTEFPTFTDRLALLERGDGSAARALIELADAIEAPRLAARTVTIQQGALRAALPLTHGAQVFLRAGSERSWLVDYEAQIAPDTWMPVPLVQRAFDGLAWYGVLDGERVECSYWISSTPSVAARSASEARLGAVQLPVRRLRAGSGAFRAGAGPRELLAPDPDGAPALGLELH